MDSLNRSIALLERLVGFPTVSADSNLALVEWAEAHLAGLGARTEVTRDPTGTKANLCARFGPDLPGGVMLAGHSDVVPAEGDWRFDPFTLTEDQGRYYGRGSADMKGFLACAMAMAEDYARLPLARPLDIVMTFDEEVACLGAQLLQDQLGQMETPPAIAIVGEPTMMRVIEGHKGCHEYTTHITGVEGHGSAPDDGVNAAQFAVRYATRLMELAAEMRTRADSQFEPPWTTINIGRIDAGTAHNVIAGQARLMWEMRPVHPSDAETIRAEIDRFAESLLAEMNHPEARIRREVVGEVEGLVPTRPNRAVALLSRLTGSNDTGLVAFGTEAGLYQEAGLHAAVCGPGSIEQAHKPDEFIARDQLVACLEMLARLGPVLTEA